MLLLHKYNLSCSSLYCRKRKLARTFKIQFGDWKNTHIKQCKWNPFCVFVCVPWRLMFRLHWRCGKSCMLSHFSHVRPFVTLWTVACHTSLSMGFSRQGYWSGLLFPSPGNVPNPGIKPASYVSCTGKRIIYH